MTQVTGKTPAAAKKAAKASKTAAATKAVAQAAASGEATAVKTAAKKAATKTVAKKAATKTVAKKTAATKTAAVKTAVAKAAPATAAATKTAETKTAAKKAATKTTVAAKKAPAAKKTAAKKATAKKAVKAVPSGRRPGRPAKSGNNADYADDDSGNLEVIPDLKPLPKRGAKRAKGERDAPTRNQLTPEEQEARRNRLKVLIKLGKDRGYLTYGEINDHLPDDLVDAEAIDGIISTFSDMGISVYDQAPDAEALLMSDNAPVATSDDDVEDEADAALNGYGRTPYPRRRN